MGTGSWIGEDVRDGACSKYILLFYSPGTAAGITRIKAHLQVEGFNPNLKAVKQQGQKERVQAHVGGLEKQRGLLIAHRERGSVGCRKRGHTQLVTHEWGLVVVLARGLVASRF